MKVQSRYLLAGTSNTCFGYFSSIGLYYALNAFLNLSWILVITSIVSITFSFLTYKLYVFRTTGNWIKEYLKCYLVYGITSVFSGTFIWYLVERAAIEYWIAQGMAVFIIVLISYILHRNFTFKINEKN